MASAELKVKRLARLESNCTCANCGAFNKFGFSTVCIKYHTFVCNMCKSSHQAISHRCKSLTMSAWTNAEVAELERKGNDHARRTWLQSAPPCGSGGRPSPDSELTVFKRFVLECYENKRYYGEDDAAAAAAASSATQPVQGPAKVKKASTKREKKASSRPMVAAVSAPAPVVDLLDFGAAEAVAPAPFEAPAAAPSHDPFASSMPPAPPAVPAPDTNSTTKNDPFQVDFASFSAPAAAAVATPAPSIDVFATLNSNNNTASGTTPPLGNTMSATSSNVMGGNNGASAGGGFDPFSFPSQGAASAAKAQETNTFASFGNFEAPSSSTAPTPTLGERAMEVPVSQSQPKSVMGNGSGGMSAISMMGAPNGGMSMMSLSNQPTMQQQQQQQLPSMTMQQQQQMLMMQMQRMNITPQQMMMMQQQIMMQNMGMNQTDGMSMGHFSTGNLNGGGSGGGSSGNNNNSSNNDAFAGITSNAFNL